MKKEGGRAIRMSWVRPAAVAAAEVAATNPSYSPTQSVARQYRLPGSSFERTNARSLGRCCGPTVFALDEINSVRFDSAFNFADRRVASTKNKNPAEAGFFFSD